MGGGESLSRKYGRLASNSEERSCRVQEMGHLEGDSWVWNLKWRRSWFVWEKEMIDELMDLIQLKVPKKEIKHRRLWKGIKSKSYSVKEGYETLQQQSNNEESDFFKNLWSIPAPSKVLTFTWKVVLDRVQTKTKEALKKRRIVMENNDYMCMLCNQTEESIAHLLFESNFWYQVWKSVYKWAHANRH